MILKKKKAPEIGPEKFSQFRSRCGQADQPEEEGQKPSGPTGHICSWWTKRCWALLGHPFLWVPSPLGSVSWLVSAAAAVLQGGCLFSLLLSCIEEKKCFLQHFIYWSFRITLIVLKNIIPLIKTSFLTTHVFQHGLKIINTMKILCLKAYNHHHSFGERTSARYFWPSSYIHGSALQFCLRFAVWQYFCRQGTLARMVKGLISNEQSFYLFILEDWQQSKAREIFFPLSFSF